MKKAIYIFFCIVISAVSAVGASILAKFAYFPGSHLQSFSNHLSYGITGFYFYAAVPLFILAGTAIIRKPSLATTLAVAIGWLVLLGLAHRQPWRSADIGIAARDFFYALPISLAYALVFSITSRKLLGPNKSMQPTPYRGG